MQRVSSHLMSASSSPILLLFLLSSVPHSLSDDTTSFIYAGCSQLKYVAGTPYQFNINSLFASLANSASLTPYANFTSSLDSPAATVYGLYQCRGDLAVPDCDACVKSCITQLSSLCSASCGGALQLTGCFVRFGNESFIGEPDKAVMYRKCGPVGGGDYTGDFVGMRESVLASLAVGGGGLFRMGRAGYVDGMAQCVGDLSPAECDDCVGEAANGLRSSCGLAVSGEVYLGKCYAKYSSRGGSSYGSHSDHGSSADESSKTLAIVIGIVAGVALVIVFLSFLSRTADGSKGKY